MVRHGGLRTYYEGKVYGFVNLENGREKVQG